MVDAATPSSDDDNADMSMALFGSDCDSNSEDDDDGNVVATQSIPHTSSNSTSEPAVVSHDDCNDLRPSHEETTDEPQVVTEQHKAALSPNTSWFEVQRWKHIFVEVQQDKSHVSSQPRSSCESPKTRSYARLCNALALANGSDPPPPPTILASTKEKERPTAAAAHCSGTSFHRVLLAFRLAGGLHVVAMSLRYHLRGGVGLSNYKALVTLLEGMKELAEDPHNIYCLGNPTLNP
jgi:hypothetical protein